MSSAAKALDASVRLAEAVTDCQEAQARITKYAREECPRYPGPPYQSCLDLAKEEPHEGYEDFDRTEYDEAWRKAETCARCGPLVTAIRDRRAARHRRAHARRALALIGRGELKRRNGGNEDA